MFWLRHKTRLLVPKNPPGPNPTDFGPIGYWSRGFVSNSLGFSLVESLHLTWDLAIATASPGEMPQILQLLAWALGLYTLFWCVIRRKKWSTNGKNQSCLKLPEMARKLIENVFWNVWPKFYPWSFLKSLLSEIPNNLIQQLKPNLTYFFH